jgi:hypothetical protein
MTCHAKIVETPARSRLNALSIIAGGVSEVQENALEKAC